MKSLLLFALSLFGIGSLQSSSPVLPTGVQNPVLTGQKAIDHLKSTGQYDSLAAAMTRARYGVKTNPGDGKTAAANPAHGIYSTFTSEGLQLSVTTSTAGSNHTYKAKWRLVSLGYGEAQTSVASGAMSSKDQRVELSRPTQHLTEWFQKEILKLELK